MWWEMGEEVESCGRWGIRIVGLLGHLLFLILGVYFWGGDGFKFVRYISRYTIFRVDGELIEP